MFWIVALPNIVRNVSYSAPHVPKLLIMIHKDSYEKYVYVLTLWHVYKKANGKEPVSIEKVSSIFWTDLNAS